MFCSIEKSNLQVENRVSDSRAFNILSEGGGAERGRGSWYDGWNLIHILIS